MGMEDFFLGAIGGAAQAGAQGASIQFQNEQELIRQQSLLDLKNRYAQGERKRQIEALLQLTDDEDEQDTLRRRAEVFGPEKAGALFLSQKEKEKADQAALKGISDLTSILDDPRFGVEDPAAAARQIQSGNAKLSDFKTDENVPYMTEEELATLPEFADASPAELELYANNPTRAIDRIEGKGEGEEKLPVELVNLKTGAVEVVPFNKARRMLESGTHSQFEIAFAGGEEVLRTASGDFPRNVPKIRDKDLTPRAKTYAALGDVVESLPEARAANIAEADPEFINPDIAIEFATGPQDRAFAGLRAFGATNALMGDESKLGEGQLRLKKELISLRALARNALVAANPGRANASTIELADQVTPDVESTIRSIFGSSENVRIELENLRGLMRSIRTTNQETVEGSFRPGTADQANAAINNANRVLGRIEALFASERIGQMRLTNKQGQTVTIANGLTTSTEVKNFLDQNKGKLSRLDLAALFQWQRHLMAKEGF